MRIRRFIAVAGTALALVPGAALGHAALVKSAPARHAVLAHPPLRVELWFSERLEAAYAMVAVQNADGTPVDTGRAIVGSDPKLLVVPVPRLGPGTYTVRFRVLSVDGHVVDSSFPFSVR